MTTITLEVPDELAVRLRPLRERLPELLSLALDLLPSEWPAPGAVYPAFEEMIDFLASGPTPQQIVAFKVSRTAQSRMEDLLDKNREQGLAEDEEAELDVYEQINFVLVLLKARARLSLN